MPGRPTGPWFKWKRDPFNIDAVLMYAQRGTASARRTIPDYTFGVWRGEEIVPVGKAYFGFTDEEPCASTDTSGLTRSTSSDRSGSSNTTQNRDSCSKSRSRASTARRAN